MNPLNEGSGAHMGGSLFALLAVSVLVAWSVSQFKEPTAGYLCRYCKGSGRFGKARPGVKQIPICPKCGGSGENNERGNTNGR